MAILIPLACLIVSGLIVYFAIRRHLIAVPVVIMILSVIGFVWAIWQGQQARGWDGIGYAIFAVLMCLPVCLGAGVGWLVGWLRNRKVRKTGQIKTGQIS